MFRNCRALSTLSCRWFRNPFAAASNGAILPLIVFTALVIFLCLVTLPLVYFVAGIGPARYLSGVFGALSIAVSTTSTAAAIPVTLEETTRNLKVSPAIADLLVPLDAVGVPVSGLAIMLGIDRIPDMARSGVNILAQISAAVLVDRWTGAGKSSIKS